MLNRRSFVIYIYNMARYGRLTAEEINKAEKARDDRLRSRKKGFSKMHERDEGQALLNNGVTMHWPVVEFDAPDKGIHVYPRRVPEGMFVLEFDGQSYLFDAEEFRRYLRWA